MENRPVASLEEAIQTLESHEVPAWDSLPELELYMDQVITLLGRRFDTLAVENDRPLTSSMINNYVKDGVMPRPDRKKYNREHLTALSIICMMKSELSLPEIGAMLRALSALHSTKEIYETFRESQTAAVDMAVSDLHLADGLDEAARLQLAMTLTLEANAKRIAASKLLSTLLPAEEDSDIPKEKEKKKKKKDKAEV